MYVMKTFHSRYNLKKYSFTECTRPNHPDNERHGVKRSLSESHRSNIKRPKSTLQAAPRPSSPVPARSKALE